MLRRTLLLSRLLLAVSSAGACASSEADGIPAPGLPFDPSACEVVGTMWGPEDLSADLSSETGPRLLVSAANRRGDSRGGIYQLGLAANHIDEQRLLADSISGCPLRPHGIHLASPADSGPRRLYVVHHGSEGDADIPGCTPPRLPDGEPARHFIAVFSVEADGLRHLTNLVSPELRSPNDLYLADDRHLYVTDEISRRNLFAATLEYLGLRAASRVLLYDGKGWREVADGIRFANGITGADGRVYVIGTFDRSIHRFERDPGHGDLLPRGTIAITSAGDNLSWDTRQRRLLVTGHRSLPRYIRHRRYPDEPSPSEILEIDPSTRPPGIARIFEDDGRIVSNASVALRHADALYIGRVHDRGVVRCPLAGERGENRLDLH